MTLVLLRTVFHNLITIKQDHVLYNQFRGIVLDKEEGQAIAQALGNKKVFIFILQSSRNIWRNVGGHSSKPRHSCGNGLYRSHGLFLCCVREGVSCPTYGRRRSCAYRKVYRFDPARRGINHWASEWILESGLVPRLAWIRIAGGPRGKHLQIYQMTAAPSGSKFCQTCNISVVSPMFSM